MSIYCPLFLLLSLHFSISILYFLTTSTGSLAHYLKASMEPLDIHKYRSDPAVFIIWLRNEDGKPERTYEDNEPTKLLVVYCINVVRYMLLDVEVEVAFKNTAREYSKVHPNSWYMEDPEPEYHMYKIARIFYESILDKFPNVFVDYTMKNPDNLGSHSRREWVEFNPRNQSIQINGMVREHVTGSSNYEAS